MAFFDDIFGAVTGQRKAAPYTMPNIGDILGQSAGEAAAANLAYNRAVAPGLMDLQLQLESKYDPNIGALRGATSQAIANELALGTSLPEEIRQLVTQSALQSGAASGFGLSPGGRSIVARDLGLTGLDLGSRRRAEAAGFVRSAPSLNQLYQPLTAFSPEGVAGENLNQANIANRRAAEDFYRKEGNKIAMFNTFGRVAGGVLGGVFGGPAGAQAGMQVGGSFIDNPYRASEPTQGGGGLFSSILTPSGSSIGGPAFGIGGGGGGNPLMTLLSMFNRPRTSSLGSLGITPAF